MTWDPIDVHEPDLPAFARAYELLKTDVAAAIKELVALSERGSVRSMILLAQVHELERYGRVDLDVAEHWFRKAASTGFARPQYVLGRTLVVRQRFEEAREILTASADQNYMPSFRLLAFMARFGKGGPVDVEGAKAMLERAIRGGNVKSRVMLGRILLAEWRRHPLRAVRGFWLFWTGRFHSASIAMREGRGSPRLY